MDEKLKEKLKDAQIFWNFKHQRIALNLAVSALMLGPQVPDPEEKPDEYLKRYLPLAEYIDRYIREVQSDQPTAWW
jgi:hypothetical protein